MECWNFCRNVWNGLFYFCCYVCGIIALIYGILEFFRNLWMFWIFGGIFQESLQEFMECWNFCRNVWNGL